jgi:hypothetical protein
MAVGPLNWNQIINENDDDDSCADPSALSGGRSQPSNGNGNDDSEGEEDTQGGERRTEKVKGTKDGKGKGKGKATEEGKGSGRETVKGKVLLNKPQEEIISLVPLLCSCTRECISQSRIRMATYSAYI